MQESINNSRLQFVAAQSHKNMYINTVKKFNTI